MKKGMVGQHIITSVEDQEANTEYLYEIEDQFDRELADHARIMKERKAAAKQRRSMSKQQRPT